MPASHQLLNGVGIYLRVYDSGRYYTTCPNCSDKRQTRHQKLKCLGVTIRDDRVFWGCNHCGWTGPERGSGGNGPTRAEWPHYDYGGLRKVRTPWSPPRPKFIWQHQNGSGKWEGGTDGADTNGLLYRIDEVREAIADGEPVLVVEGEKDVDTCWRLGFAATCNAHGASEKDKAPKWTDAHSEQLRGADLVVLWDNDAAGLAHADAVLTCSLGKAASLRTIDLAEEWPDIPPGGDVSDWVARGGGSAEALEQLIEEARHYHPTGESVKAAPALEGFTMSELKGEEFPPMKWIVPRYIPEGVTLLAGKPKVGKSWLMLTASLAVARADLVLCEHCEQRNVLYCALEDNKRRLKERTEKLIGLSEDWPDNMRVTLELPNVDHGGIAKLEQYLDAEPIDLIIIDTLAKFRGRKGKEEQQYECDYRTISLLLDLSRRRNVSIIVVHHVRKQTSDDIFDTISGTMGLSGAADTLVVLTRAEDDQLRLCVRGRDVEPEDKIVTFDSEMGEWLVAGDYEPPEGRGGGKTSTAIMAMLIADRRVTPKQVAEKLGIRDEAARAALSRMAKKGQVKNAGYGVYERL